MRLPPQTLQQHQAPSLLSQRMPQRRPQYLPPTILRVGEVVEGVGAGDVGVGVVEGGKASQGLGVYAE